MGKIKPLKKIKIGKNITVNPGVESKLKKKPGSSNVGKYKTVKKKDFAGTKGGAAPGSFPINTRKRARAALSYAHNAPNPEGIRAAVHKKYPSLGGKKKKRK